MKIDRFELTKQRKAEILENGDFARIEILIPRASATDECVDPIVEFEMQNTNTVTMVCLVNLLDKLKQTIFQKYPEIRLAMELIGTKIVDLGATKKGDIVEVED